MKLNKRRVKMLAGIIVGVLLLVGTCIGSIINSVDYEKAEDGVDGDQDRSFTCWTCHGGVDRRIGIQCSDEHRDRHYYGRVAGLYRKYYRTG